MTEQSAIVQGKASLPGYALPPLPPHGARVILLRHGRSTLNDAGCYQGSSDHSQITNQGRVASRQVGHYLRDCPIHHLYTSPLQRSQQTVKELLPQLKGLRFHPPTTLGMLREIDLPNWEGLRYEEVKTCFPDAYHCWQTNPEQFAMEIRREGERNSQTALKSLIYPVREVYERARKFWRATLPKHQGETLLVVSHGSTIQALVNTALGVPMQQHHFMQQTHSGLTVIDFAAPVLGTGHLHLLNLTTPIDERLPKLKAGKQGFRLVILPCQPGTKPDALLTECVQGQPIAACVVEDHPCCHPNQHSLLTHHHETVTLSVGQTDFLHQWQRSLAQSLIQMSSSNLITVAAVCRQAHAEPFLQGVMGRHLPLLPNALTILHYPSTRIRPILQTLNSRPVPINL
jgi:phosphoserine phosphatase